MVTRVSCRFRTSTVTAPEDSIYLVVCFFLTRESNQEQKSFIIFYKRDQAKGAAYPNILKHK